MTHLSADTVESGKEHPFVVALVKELKERRAGAWLQAEQGPRDSSERSIGIAAGFREVIRMIEQAKGKDE